MGDSFKNYGQAVNMGNNGVNIGNTLTQNNNGKDKYEITDEDICKLKLLIDKLGSYTEEEISKRDATKASSYLYDLIEAVEKKDDNEKEEVLSKWKSWIGKASDKTIKTLGIIADVVTIGMPIATMLGLAATTAM